MPFRVFSRRIMPVVAGLVFLALWFAPHALAQNATTEEDRLANLNIQVRPEFDQPNVLVIYSGELAAKDKLPRSVSLLIPKDAQLNATAYIDANDQLLNTEPAKTEDAGDGYTRVTFNVPTPKFQLEFYYNPLQGSPDKKMDYVYKTAQPTDQLQLLIQEPLKSENFTTAPASIVQTSSAHNFKYHVFDYTNLEAGKIVSVQVSYRKTDPNPSIQNVEVPASAGQASAASSVSPLSVAGPVLIAGALALFALGGYAYWSRRRAEYEPEVAAPTGSRRRSRRSSGGGGGFCPQCGRALDADDNFCPKCGTPRRRSS